PDYDMGVARLLTRGADVWLNNPIRPLEACGTSGMKAALNGGLNLSVIDGWAIGDGSSGAPDQDERDRAALYATLENEVLPAYADPGRWADMMRASIVTAERGFTSDRM